MNILGIVKQLTAKDSPFKKVMGLNKAGTTKGDAIAVVMSFIQQEFITKMLDGMHKYYQAELKKLPAGHLIEYRVLPDVERRQLKILVEDVCGNERRSMYTIYTRDITTNTIQQQLINLLGGSEAMQQPFVLEEFTKTFKTVQ